MKDSASVAQLECRPTPESLRVQFLGRAHADVAGLFPSHPGTYGGDQLMLPSHNVVSLSLTLSLSKSNEKNVSRP